MLERLFQIDLVGRGQELILRGDENLVEEAVRVISELIFMVNKNGSLSADDIETVFRLSQSPDRKAAEHDPDSIVLYTKNGMIKPKTPGQNAYYQSTKKNDIVVAIGPAGTGKTYLAVAVSVAHLRENRVDRIVLCRPAVEAGESLGFLPGDFREKVDPYLRPLYDALHEMIPQDKLKRFLETRIVEIVPLAYMRGRTLNNSFVILDEAQNTTSGQMKMFLTRLGANTRAIITGDITQIDLPSSSESGLIQIQDVLKGIDGIDFVYLHERDVVRHQLVKKIIRAYKDYATSSENDKNIPL
ncbi:PhoH family protein [candidate division KSB1 bacterium]|nr:PhoH family protein [candidate division KSB1 bacterium]